MCHGFITFISRRVSELDFPGVEPTGPLPSTIDFPLYPVEEPDAFDVIFFGDPQPRDQKEIDYIAHDVVEDLVGVKAAFGVTLGDILFDDLSLFDSFNRTLGKDRHSLVQRDWQSRHQLRV